MKFWIHGYKVRSPEFRFFFDMSDFEQFYLTITTKMNLTSLFRYIYL